MAIYSGKRTPSGVVVTVDGLPLPVRLDLRSHSPTGFEWGYQGSGPAQLALALLVHRFTERRPAAGTRPHVKRAMAEEAAMRRYQDFKRHVVAAFTGDTWSLSSEEIDEKLRQIDGRGLHSHGRAPSLRPGPDDAA